MKYVCVWLLVSNCRNCGCEGIRNLVVGSGRGIGDSDGLRFRLRHIAVAQNANCARNVLAESFRNNIVYDRTHSIVEVSERVWDEVLNKVVWPTPTHNKQVVFLENKLNNQLNFHHAEAACYQWRHDQRYHHFGVLFQVAKSSLVLKCESFFLRCGQFHCTCVITRTGSRERGSTAAAVEPACAAFRRGYLKSVPVPTAWGCSPDVFLQLVSLRFGPRCIQDYSNI